MNDDDGSVSWAKGKDVARTRSHFCIHSPPSYGRLGYTNQLRREYFLIKLLLRIITVLFYPLRFPIFTKTKAPIPCSCSETFSVHYHDHPAFFALGKLYYKTKLHRNTVHKLVPINERIVSCSLSTSDISTGSYCLPFVHIRGSHKPCR